MGLRVYLRFATEKLLASSNLMSCLDRLEGERPRVMRAYSGCPIV